MDRSVAKIGAAFHRVAMGPLSYASTLLAANQVKQALAELGPQGLADAYQRGLAEVADLVGVPKGEVDRLMPLEELGQVLERLRFSHHRAELAYQAHAGQFGFLDTVTQLTADGRAPDITECLDRVAKKLRADEELSEPLAALAADTTAWTDLLTRSRFILEDRSWLAAAYRRRVIIRSVVLAIPVIALILFTISVVFLRLRRDGIDAVLAQQDVCQAESLTQERMRFATAAQTKAREDRVAACAAAREADRRQKELAEEEERKARLAQERAEARAKDCLALATAIAKKSLSARELETAGDLGPFASRLANLSLEPADIGPKDPRFPCEDTDSQKSMRALYKAALLADVSVWTRRGHPGPLTRAVLLESKDDISQNARLGLADNAERTAKAGLLGGDAGVIAKARSLCSLASELGVPGRGSCEAILRLP